MGNRGKLVKALQTSAIVLLENNPYKLSHSFGVGMRAGRSVSFGVPPPNALGSYLVDPASSHMLVSKIKPCMSKYKLLIL